ncbi:hypothetical protein FRC04_009798 [Tulasnella sp. 424]|nr:hypothetical protein FRC04_009798 [Tulasnella sp. 424]KAG8971165.1 hypothetical protein FRC05_011449 [Tulasnella sp. 425]
MVVFGRSTNSSRSSSCSSDSSSSIPKTLRNRSRSSTAKAPKPSAPSLTKRISSSIRPTPKPQPSLIRRASSSLSDFDSARWEKRMLKRIQRFQRDHPILMRVIGTGLCIAGAGVSALAMPAVLGAFGIKLAVANAPMMLAEGLAAGSAALPMTTANIAAGAKVLALDIGKRLLAGPPESPTERGMFGFLPRRKNSNSSTLTESESRVGVLGDLPLVSSTK